MYRIIYELNGSGHTRWTRDWTVTEDRIIEFVDVETGYQKHLTTRVPLNITDVGDSVPPRIQEAIVDD